MQALHLLNSLKHGGGENVAFNYSRVLNKLQVTSVFVGKRGSVEYERMLSTVGEIRHKLSFKTLYYSDFIFVHSNINLLRLIGFKFLPLNWHQKKVIYIQHLEYSERKFALLSHLINWICSDFIQITPLTQHYVSKYIKIQKHFIANFYLNKYPKSEWESIRNKVRINLDISGDKQIITFCSVFKPGKNVGKFISLARSMQDCHNVVFLLLGDGEESSIVKKYDGDNILWTGFVNDVEAYLIASDIYVFLSNKEMMPMSLIEAINTDKYIVCYKNEVNDYLLEGHTFNVIDRNTLVNTMLPSGQYLKHYGEDYALEKLSSLLFGE